MEALEIMPEQEPKRQSKKNKEKWLTVQISDEEHEALELYCTEKGISKTTVIRDFLANIRTYTELMDLLKKKAMRNVLNSLRANEEISDVPTKSSPSILPEEITKQKSIEADIDELFGE
jgi:hypothetical protein